MNPTTCFRDIVVSDDLRSIKFYAKKGATWTEIEAEMNAMYGDDPHMKWMGFGEPGGEFILTLVRKECSPHLCDCKDDDDDSSLNDEDYAGGGF
jgi:hypothetical protein